MQRWLDDGDAHDALYDLQLWHVAQWLTALGSYYYYNVVAVATCVGADVVAALRLRGDGEMVR